MMDSFVQRCYRDRSRYTFKQVDVCKRIYRLFDFLISMFWKWMRMGMWGWGP